MSAWSTGRFYAAIEDRRVVAHCLTHRPYQHVVLYHWPKPDSPVLAVWRSEYMGALRHASCLLQAGSEAHGVRIVDAVQTLELLPIGTRVPPRVQSTEWPFGRGLGPAGGEMILGLRLTFASPQSLFEQVDARRRAAELAALERMWKL